MKLNRTKIIHLWNKLIDFLYSKWLGTSIVIIGLLVLLLYWWALVTVERKKENRLLKMESQIEEILNNTK